MDRNEIFEYVKKQYGTDPEYLWADSPDSAVLRNPKTGKWYALFMKIPAVRLGLKSDEEIDILDLKCQPDMVDILKQTKGFFPAYHMNKRHWITLPLNGEISDSQIFDYLDWSYDLVDGKKPDIKEDGDLNNFNRSCG